MISTQTHAGVQIRNQSCFQARPDQAESSAPWLTQTFRKYSLRFFKCLFFCKRRAGKFFRQRRGRKARNTPDVLHRVHCFVAGKSRRQEEEGSISKDDCSKPRERLAQKLNMQIVDILTSNRTPSEPDGAWKELNSEDVRLGQACSAWWAVGCQLGIKAVWGGRKEGD